jgi:hypothetical protein
MIPCFRSMESRQGTLKIPHSWGILGVVAQRAVLTALGKELYNCLSLDRQYRGRSSKGRARA